MNSALITRLSKLDAPDREVDAMIYCFEHGHTYSRKYGNDFAMWVEGVPHEVRIMDLCLDRFTASVDAVVALTKRKLPDANVLIGWGQTKETKPWARIGVIPSHDATGFNSATALLIALLRAKEASKS